MAEVNFYEIWNLILASIYFILPAYAANMAPVIAAKIKAPGAIPVSKKYLGEHKTWRGIYSAYLFALAALALQSLLQNYEAFSSVSMLNYQNINIFLYAFLMGIGAITGDTVKSFFKRLIGIKPGGIFFPFDQIDFVLGSYIFCLPVFILPWQNLLALLAVTPLLHFLSNVLAYFLGFKKVWW
jgi:CDP-2,3-bis-(O-geranylgeranyl)-sn-glycerol synthase